MGIKNLIYFCTYAGALSAIVIGFFSEGYREISLSNLAPFGLAFALIACVLEPLLLAESLKDRLRRISYSALLCRGVMAAILCALCWWGLYWLGNKFKNEILFIIAGYGAAIGFGFLGLTIGSRKDTI